MVSEKRGASRASLVIWMVALSAMACQSETTDGSEGALRAEVAMHEAAIVGGVPEPGFAAVGALTISSPQFGYYGSFCSGTLITAEWVLTAAHCLTGEGGMAAFLVPQNTYFYMGPDATSPNPGVLPSQGAFAAAAAFYVHPQYGSGGSGNDIALVRLAAPVQGVDPIPFYPGPFGEAFIGNSITYVGFGVNDGITNSGGGVKRSGKMSIAWVEPGLYGSVFEGQGVCFGDSGGPGLRQFEEKWHVIGVNSAVIGDDESDPCTQYAVHTRTDSYSDWVLGILADPPPIVGCLLDKGVCACDDACMADGSCDDSVCPVPGSCAALYECVSGCNSQSCAQSCFAQATPDSQQAFSTMATCLNNQCSGAQSQQEYQSCALTACGSEVTVCFDPDGTSPGTTCAQTYQCILGCTTQGCVQSCYEAASLPGQVALQQMLTCYEDFCADSQGSQQQFQQCAVANCGEEIDGCFNPTPAPDTCVPLGVCPEGEACVPVGEGEAACVPTTGLAAGEPCDGTGENGVECAGGLVCAPAGQGVFACMPYCGPGHPCPDDQACTEWPGGLPQGAGVCGCKDADGDGACAVDDCDDTQSAMTPGKAEECGDGLDNDCTGSADDGCGVPVAEEGGAEEGSVDEGGAVGEGGGVAAGADTGSLGFLEPFAEGPSVTLSNDDSAGGGCATVNGAPSPVGSAGLFALWLSVVLLRRRR